MMSHDSASSLPAGVPPEAVPFLQEMGYLEADTVRVSDPAPIAPLFAVDGEPCSLADLWHEQPAVLIFGSYT